MHSKRAFLLFTWHSVNLVVTIVTDVQNIIIDISGWEGETMYNSCSIFKLRLLTFLRLQVAPHRKNILPQLWGIIKEGHHKQKQLIVRSVFHFCRILTKLWMFWRLLIKILSVKSHEISYCGRGHLISLRIVISFIVVYLLHITCAYFASLTTVNRYFARCFTMLYFIFHSMCPFKLNFETLTISRQRADCFI